MVRRYDIERALLAMVLVPLVFTGLVALIIADAVLWRKGNK